MYRAVRLMADIIIIIIVFIIVVVRIPGRRFRIVLSVVFFGDIRFLERVGMGTVDLFA